MVLPSWIICDEVWRSTKFWGPVTTESLVISEIFFFSLLGILPLIRRDGYGAEAEERTLTKNKDLGVPTIPNIHLDRKSEVIDGDMLITCLTPRIPAISCALTMLMAAFLSWEGG